jgi:chemotaxis protein methyltransferase CheR
MSPLENTRASPPGRVIKSVATEAEFKVFRDLIHAHTGIALGPQKRLLLEARLAKRLRSLRLSSFTEYHRYLLEQDATGEELTRCLNAITTNKTDFFREEHHFRYLAEEWVPALRTGYARTGSRTVRVWSAGCSTGEEPYTIGMTLLEAFGAARGWDIRILASDIDTEVLDRAAAGIYSLEQAAAVAKPLLARYCLRGIGDRAGFVCMRPELRALVTFRRINFLDDPWPIRTRFDAIFCRNVLIYFDRPTQQRVLERFVGLLKDDAVLFLGHSENIHGLVSGIDHIGNTIYRRRVTARGDAAGGTPREEGSSCPRQS